VCFASAALLLSFSSSTTNAFILIVVAALATYAVHRIGVFRRPAQKDAADLRVVIGEIADRLQKARHVSEVLECVSAITPAVGAAHVSAWTGRAAGGAMAATAATPHVAQPRVAQSAWLRARYPLADVGGFIEVTWSDGRDAVGPTEDAALNDVSAHLADALRRVNGRTETPIAVLRPVPRQTETGSHERIAARSA